MPKPYGSIAEDNEKSWEDPMTTTWDQVDARKRLDEFDPVALKAVDKFREWLNLWYANDRTEKWPIDDAELIDFFRYNETEVLNDFSWGGWRQYRHIILTAGNGDDGGASTLFSTFERWAGDEDDSWRLVYLVQEFDTALQPIFRINYADNKPTFVNIPGAHDDQDGK